MNNHHKKKKKKKIQVMTHNIKNEV